MHFRTQLDQALEAYVGRPGGRRLAAKVTAQEWRDLATNGFVDAWRAGEQDAVARATEFLMEARATATSTPLAPRGSARRRREYALSEGLLRYLEQDPRDTFGVFAFRRDVLHGRLLAPNDV